MHRISAALAPLLLVLVGCGTAAAQAPNHHAATRYAHPSVAERRLKLGGKEVTALTAPSGLTLYYFTPDTARHPSCTGACAALWPPLRARGPVVPPKGLKGHLTTVRGANGLQLEYNGHPLYTFSGDKRPGQTNGQGLQRRWWVATVGLAARGPSAGGGSSTPSGSSGSSGAGW